MSFLYTCAPKGFHKIAMPSATRCGYTRWLHLVRNAGFLIYNENIFKKKEEGGERKIERQIERRRKTHNSAAVVAIACSSEITSAC